MPIYTETIINRWFGNQKNLDILNGIVRHKNDKQIAKEHKVRIDRVANYRSKLKKKGLLTAGFFNINHEKLGLIQLMDFPKENPSIDDIFLTYLVRISRPFGYLRLRLLPPEMAEDGYQLGVGIDVMNEFTVPFVKENFTNQFEDVVGQTSLDLYEGDNYKESEKINLLSVYICKEVQKGKYGARTLASAISQQIDEDELGIQPSISNVNRRLKLLKEQGVIQKSSPLNLVPLKPYYDLNSAIVKKNHDFEQTLAALAKLNVTIKFSTVLNEPEKAYIILEYHYSQKWDILKILNKHLEEITFFDHAPYGERRTIPFEYFEEIFSKRKYI
jgi:hypothetical protein